MGVTKILWATLLDPAIMLERASLAAALHAIVDEPVDSAANHYAESALRSLAQMREYTGRRNCKHLRGFAKAAAHDAVRRTVVELELDARRLNL